MPRSLVLISTSSSWRRVEEILKQLHCSAEFVRTTHAVIEAWCPCIGNADYAVRLYGLSLESLRKASAVVREAIASQTDASSPVRVTTGSIAGSTMCEMLGPRAAVEMMTRWIDMAEKEAAAAAPHESEHDPKREVEVAALVQAAVIDTVCQLQSLVDGVAKGGPTVKAVLEPLSRQLGEVLKKQVDACLVRTEKGWESRPGPAKAAGALTPTITETGKSIRDRRPVAEDGAAGGGG